MNINYNKIDYDVDDQLSFKDFTGWDFNDRPEYDFSNKIIYASCFSNETPDKAIFNLKTENATFIKCNLMNVKVPDTAIVIDCQTQRFKVQNDLEDWIISESDGLPVEPLNKELFDALNISKDPADIPSEKQDENVTSKEAKKKATETIGVKL